ncbi:MAG TPA: hypothetical protein VFC96_03845 [Anaerovoracaceae bacterium]|nr:hypothetical protein [Anaerovoracaceae bacterium]
MVFLLKKLYGRNTEKTSAINGQPIIEQIGQGLFNEAEVAVDSKVLEPVPFKEPIKRTRRGYKRKEIFRNLPQQDQENRPSIFNPYTPESVLRHSYAVASSVAWTMYQKFV